MEELQPSEVRKTRCSQQRRLRKKTEAYNKYQKQGKKAFLKGKSNHLQVMLKGQVERTENFLQNLAG